MPDHDDRVQLADRQAPEHAGMQSWFHGSPHRIADGALIEPDHEPVNMEGEPDGYVYFTGTPEAAAGWAREGSRYLNEEGYRGYRSNPHVYEVEPAGEYERDPTAEFPGECGDHRSARPLRVIRERHDLGLMHDFGCLGCNPPAAEDDAQRSYRAEKPGVTEATRAEWIKANAGRVSARLLASTSFPAVPAGPGARPARTTRRPSQRAQRQIRGR